MEFAYIEFNFAILIIRSLTVSVILTFIYYLFFISFERNENGDIIKMYRLKENGIFQSI